MSTEPDNVSLDDIVAVNGLDSSNADIVLEPFLYGIYTILFAFCLYILRTRHQPWIRWHIISMSTLYALSTIHLALFLRTATSSSEDEWNTYDFAGATVFILSNIIADIVLIVRCYAIMGFKKRFVAPAFISWLCTIGFGIVTLVLYNRIHWVIPGAGQVTTIITIFLAIFTNVLVTGISAGRIWWITRTSRFVMGNSAQQHYNRIVAIIIESGIINPVFGAIYGSLFFLPMGPTRFAALRCMSVVLSQSCGIIPTMIIVRVGLGWSVEHTKTNNLAESTNVEFGAITSQTKTGPMFTTQIAIEDSDMIDVTRTQSDDIRQFRV